MTTYHNTRKVQIGLLVLLVICVAQVGWWILDQWLYMRELSELAGMSDAVSELSAVIDQDRRMNRYLWEGGFFLVVLLAGMGVLARAVRQEARLRYRQQVFLAAVSHELRSPLTACRVAAETLRLRDPVDTAERSRLVDRVLRNTGRLENMVTNLLDTARIEEGALRLEPEPLQLLGSLESVIGPFRERAAEMAVRFEVELDPGLQVQADPEALRTVVRNLLDNAFRAVEAGRADDGGTEGAERGAGSDQGERDGNLVRLAAEPAGAGVKLVVEDAGIGFAPADRERIFERFWRPGDEMRRSGQGAGLGLHIARTLARRSGAKLTAWSEGPGTGARFELDWPAGGA